MPELVEGLEHWDHESVLPFLEPMLAFTGPIAAPATDWAFEPKLDGWRALVYFDGGLTVRSRNGHDITAAVPELAPMVEQLAGRSVVLDGELVARQGRPWEFYGLGARLGARSSVAAARGRVRTPVTFAAFDLLVLDGEVVTRLPWVERHASLDAMALQGPAWCNRVDVRRSGNRPVRRVCRVRARGPRREAAVVPCTGRACAARTG